MLQWRPYVLLRNRVLPLLLSSAWLSLDHLEKMEIGRKCILWNCRFHMYILSHKEGSPFQRHLPAFKGTSNADNWTEPDLSFLPAVLTNALFSTFPLVFTPKHFPLWITDITQAHLAARSVDFPPFSLPGFRLEHKSHLRQTSSSVLAVVPKQRGTDDYEYNQIIMIMIRWL